MVQNTKNYIYQYKLLFYLSWICLYLFFPAWISSHLTFQAGSLHFNDQLARSLVILGLIIYFSLSAYLTDRYFKALTIDKPIIIKIRDWSKHIKDNLWLVLVCCLSVVLHIYPLSLPLVVTGGGEAPYIYLPLRIYDFLNSYWYRLFDVPVQYLFWPIVLLTVLITKQKKIITYISDRFLVYKSNKLITFFFIVSMFAFFSMYSYLFPYYSLFESLQLLRYPPVSKFIYLITYYAFGPSYVGPRIVQLIFYVLGAVYLYRTIYLFREKETALLGATIYLFSPIIFSYASRAALASGTVFFMILISFYFLRFIKNKDNRDLVLTAYFIGIGFLYKQDVLILFCICFAYLLYSKIIKRDWHPLIHFKILLLSLIPILPWLKIGAQGVSYEITWASLFSFERIITYHSMIQSQISLIIFILFIVAISYTLIINRDDLSLFFGLYFIGYYLFFFLQQGGPKGGPRIHRYLTALYPAIAVFLAQFVFSITQRIRWRYIFKLSFSVISIYLIILCLVPRSSSSLITYKYSDYEGQYYPLDEAMDWIKRNTGNKENILFLFMANKVYIDRFYTVKNGADLNRILYVDAEKAKELIYPLKNLKEFCYTNKISYIMFPFGPNNYFTEVGGSIDTKYLVGNMYNEFVEVAKFSLDDNYIVIYKIKEKSI